MICPTCHHDMPGDTMLCAECLKKLSYRGYLKRQEQHMPEVLAGKLALKLAMYAHAKPHLVLFGDDHHSWCGESIRIRKPRAERYDEALLDKVCPRCAELFKAAAQNATVQA